MKAAGVQVPTDPEAYYRELTLRNVGFIPERTQQRLRGLKVLIAGCGAAGGACIEPLARLGVEHFRLADNGAYELNNLNRQHARLESLGQNKAQFHREELLHINPFIDVEVHPHGITPENTGELVRWADLVVEEIDVTEPVAMQRKCELHAEAHAQHKPVVTGLDLGFCQYGMSFDYRRPEVAPMGGRLEATRSARHPLKALFTYVPLEALPHHCLPHLAHLLREPGTPVSQLGCASDLLSAVIVSVVVRFASSGELVPGWNLNLEELALTAEQREALAAEARGLRARLAEQLQALP